MSIHPCKKGTAFVKKSLGCLAWALPFAFAASQLSAAPIAYTIQFTLSSGSPAPVSGSFDYDSSAPLDEAFSDFMVDWDGASYNLTAGANDPTIYGTPIASCTPSDDSAGVFYALLKPSDCPAPSSPDGQTEWEGSPESSTVGEFEFVFGSEADALAIYAQTGTTSEVPSAIGEFTTTEATPEPGSMSLIILGALALGGPAIRLRQSLKQIS